MEEKARNLEEILQTVAKLLNMTEDRGTTENEAAIAAACARRLLEKHQLTMFDVENRTSSEAVKEVNCDSEYTRTPPWKNFLFDRIGAAFDCKTITDRWFDKTRKYGTYVKVRFIFIGKESDAAIAAYFYDTLCRRLWALATESGRKNGYAKHALTSYRNSFIIAASVRILERLQSEKAQEVKTGKVSRALVVVKGRDVVKYIEQHFPDLGIRTYRLGDNYTGTTDGREAGDKIDLIRGVGGDGKEPRPIGNTKQLWHE